MQNTVRLGFCLTDDHCCHGVRQYHIYESRSPTPPDEVVSLAVPTCPSRKVVNKSFNSKEAQQVVACNGPVQWSSAFINCECGNELEFWLDHFQILCAHLLLA